MSGTDDPRAATLESASRELAVELGLAGPAQEEREPASPVA